MPRPLSPDEIARFQALVKPAAVLLLMLRLDRPSGARELADLLGFDEHTVSSMTPSLPLMVGILTLVMTKSWSASLH